ncbi:MAG TPA: TolC family protein, partial [Candidatus Angelobacter sp.]|nr:TolC family protein [Candidatus Angelobacter sp.]
MSRASLLLACILLPNFVFAQPTIPLSTSRTSAEDAAGRRTTMAAQQSPTSAAARLITLDDAIQLALANSPSIKAARTQIQQSQAQEITANLRPNPVVGGDSQFIPFFNPGQFSQDVEQYDIGLGYT